MHKVKYFIFKNKIELIVFVLAFIFSWWLMFSTFSYKDNSMIIASKAWSDFASHIPLIRSFSFGDNFPPQYPLFSGPAIKYHFLFYLFVGFLEKIGFRIDYALNIPSVLGFSFLILMIYIFAKELFKSRIVGIISIIFFIFNGSLSFLIFLGKHHLSNNLISQIIHNTSFPSFGPYDQGIVSAFWNLNIYTNQRHLAPSYALSLFIIYLILKFEKNQENLNAKKTLLIGVLLGLSFSLNMAVFLMTIIILSCMSILFRKKKLYIWSALGLALIIALPQYLFMQESVSTFKFSIHPGYLVNNLNFINFVSYWFQNLGIHSLLIIPGFLIARKISKKIFLSFLSLFIVGNLIQFSPEIAANHKFFNYFMIIGVMFSGYFLVFLWNKHHMFKPLIVSVFFLLIFSGIIDFFPIFNDNKITLSDYPKNKDIAWIIKNTDAKSTFLNTQYLYDNASLAGRKIFLGWPYFAWSQGYDTLTRDNLRKSLLSTNDLNYFCKNAKINKLGYAEISPTTDFTVNKTFFDSNFKVVFRGNLENNYIYDLRKVCKL